MSDQEMEARLQRVERAIAREIATGVDNPLVAEIRKVRREISRKCDYDTKKYARYINEQTAAFEREWGIKLKRWNKPGGPVKMPAQKGGKGA